MSDNVAEWLKNIGLEQYSDVFIENEITWELLSELDHEVLTTIGITLAGHRIRIIKASKALGVDAAEFLPPSNDDMPSSNILHSTIDDKSKAERRQLTVMFCDLVGSTALSESMDPENYRDILTEYRTAAAREVKQYDGYIGKHMGDGLLIYFGYPQAHEDDAERAVRAGLAIVEAVSRLSLTNNKPPHVRIGISTGLVVAGDIIDEDTSEERAVLGDTPNLAARLQSLADPDNVIISDSTRRLLSEMFYLKPLGNQNLKGISTPVRAFRVEGLRVVETRFSAAHSTGHIELVGRQQELALLIDRWEQAKTSEGQIVVLTGEAGIGKSCVASALINSLSQERYRRISYQCSPYHSDSALYPTIQQLTFASRFGANDTADEKLSKLEALLHLGQDDITEAIPLLGALLGIGEVAESRYGVVEYTPQKRRERTLQVLVEQLIGIGRSNPILFVIEDAHWIDPTTLDLLELTLDQISRHRIMLLVTARPTFSHGFGAHPIVSTLSLNRLGREQVIAIVKRFTKGKTLPSPLLAEIVAKTDGVPLFIEELTKTLLESGQLREMEAEYVIDGKVDQLSIPNSLHDSLMSRLDRMQSVKEIAQIAACIGREFSYALLEVVSPISSSELTTALDQLVEAEIIFKRGVPPEAKYTFKHALVRDAAYESLLKTNRAKIHERLFSQLEAEVIAVPEVLAYHATNAGLLSKAIDYWEKAGDQAVERPAFDEAISHFQRALQCSDSLDSDTASKADQLDLLVKLSNASTARYGYSHPETVKAKAAARRILDTVEETPHRIPLLYGSWVTNHVISDHRNALKDADSLCFEAEKTDDRVQGLIGYRLRGSSYEMIGDLGAADINFARAFELNDPIIDAQLANKFGSDPGVSIRICWAIALLCRGEGHQALDLIVDIEDSARELGHINAYAYTLFHLSWFMGFGKLSDRERLISLSKKLADKYDLKMWYAYSYIYEGSYLHDEGQYAEAVKQFTLGFKMTGESHVNLTVPYHHAVHASSLAALGRFDEASKAEKTALDMIDKGSEQIATAEIYRILAEIHYWQRGDSSKAIDGLKRAKDIAVTQGAALWNLRVSVSLARILEDQDESDQAIDMLQAVVEQFPVGGRDLPDMKTAREQLAKLNDS